MKKGLTFLFFVSVAFSFTTAQEETHFFNENANKLTFLNPVKTSHGTIRVLDSIVKFVYDLVLSEWKPKDKFAIISRHWGTDGWPNEMLYYSYKDNAWKVYYYQKFDYFPNHSLEKILVKAYNDFLEEFIDTVFFDHRAPYRDQFSDSLRIMEIEANYDFNVNSLTYGYKTYSVFLTDSQYHERYSYAYNPATEKYDIKQEKETYEYNSQNLPAIKTFYNWNTSTETYENSERYMYAYYNNGLLKTYVHQYFSTIWLNSNKEEYTYYPNGLKKTSVSYITNSMNQFIPDYKDSMVYNSNGLLIKKYYYGWNNVQNQWIPWQRSTYTYNAQELLLQELFEQWNGTNWDLYFRNTYTYNAQGKLTQLLQEGYDKVTSTWIIYYKTTYQYDPTGLYETERINYVGDPPTPFSRYSTTYDSYNNPTMYIYSTWDNGTSSWIPDYKYIYYWSDWNANALPDPENFSLNIYPNPSQNEILISSDYSIQYIQLYDITGKTLNILNPNSRNCILSLTPYPRGTYLLDVMTSHGKIRKLVIKN
ncbi:MAG: T9SS type A sorting domain-containing protein [Bacteroidales bacterium]|nr:T9SS type A sorting domain-containing protein [Bacteroidales bacterium]